MRVSIIGYEARPDLGRGVPRYTYELLTNLIKLSKVRGKPLDIRYIRFRGLPWDLHYIGETIVKVHYAIPLWFVKSHVYHAVWPSLAIPLVLSRKHPLVVTVHDLFGEYGQTFKVKKSISEFIFKSCDKIITIADYWRRELIYNFGVDEEKIVVIPNGVDHRRFKPQSYMNENGAKLRKESSEHVILYVGGLEIKKGVGVLLEAFKIVLQKMGNVRLLIGGKGPDEWYFKDLTLKLGIGKHVSFLGFIPEEKLPLYYAFSDVFVYPTFIGLGLSTLEAMACGTPVISTNVYNTPEYLGDAAILVRPGDSKMLADAIIDVLTDENLKMELRKKGLARARMFSWENTAKRTLEVYESLV